MVVVVVVVALVIIIVVVVVVIIIPTMIEIIKVLFVLVTMCRINA